MIWGLAQSNRTLLPRRFICRGAAMLGVNFMEQKTFFEHYRICVREDGSPQELGQTALCTIYKGVDTRSGDSVAIKLIPIASLDESTREQFEEQGRSAQALDHINIAKIHAFGVEGDQFVYVGEHLEGETTEAWVATHGPMAPDVVLRIALQVVSALGVATFHKLTHRAIQPSNLVIAPGPTAEGDWPLVKLINPGFAATPTATNGVATATETSNFLQFASPEQLQHAPVDFRSEIYSLGCTMCFLLTGSAPFPAAVTAAQRLSTSPRFKQLRRLPKSIRNLIGHMLRDNPDERPQDPVALADYMRDCLAGLDRRQSFARRFGLPPIMRRAALVAAIEKPRRPLPMKALAIAAAIVLLLGLGTMAAVLLPKNLSALWHRESKTIGVAVGVPENPPATTEQNVARAPAQTAAPSPAANIVNASPVQAPPPVSNETAASLSPAAQASSTPIVTAQSSEPRPPAQGPQTVWEREAGRTIHEAPTAQTPQTPETADNEEANNDSQSTVARKSQTGSTLEAGSKTETNTTSSAKRRTASTRTTRPRLTTSRAESGLPPLRSGSFRAEFLGTTPDGRLIFGMPNGEVKYLRPRAHRFRHYPIERREPPFQAPYQPYDN